MKLKAVHEAKYAEHPILTQVNNMMNTQTYKLNYFPIKDYEEAHDVLVQRFGQPDGYAVPRTKHDPIWTIPTKHANRVFEIILGQNLKRGDGEIYVHTRNPLTKQNLQEAKYHRSLDTRKKKDRLRFRHMIRDLVNGHFSRKDSDVWLYAVKTTMSLEHTIDALSVLGRPEIQYGYGSHDDEIYYVDWSNKDFGLVTIINSPIINPEFKYIIVTHTNIFPL